ncbi:MAG: O-antigen ligase family protein [Candidatus Roizmanbacteria bacterium]|nr:O-antigen ligase family protein [Candidatus Roizmanbacteria bacterium]
MQGIWYFLGERSFSIFTPGIAKAYFMGVEFLRPYGTFSHPNSLGGFYLLIYAFILTQKRITNKFVKSIFLFITSALILISFSRSAIITYVVINLFYLARNMVACKTCFLAKVSLALVLILFALNISGDLNSFQKRTDFFEKSLSIIAQKPFSGTGIGSYLIAQHHYPQKFSTFFEQPVHNIFLLLIAQLGIPLSVLLFMAFYRIKKMFMENIDILLPFLSVFITGNVDHYWITLQQNLLVLTIISAILFLYETETSRNR